MFGVGVVWGLFVWRSYYVVVVFLRVWCEFVGGVFECVFLFVYDFCVCVYFV